MATTCELVRPARQERCLLIVGHLLVLVDNPRVVHTPAHAIPDRARRLRVHGKPPEPLVRAEDLFPVPCTPDVKLALRVLLALQVLDRSVVVPHQFDMKLDELCERAQQQEGQAEGKHDKKAGKHEPSGWTGCAHLRIPLEEFGNRPDNDDHEADIHVPQQLDEEFSVVEADAIVDPWAMVVHVQDATVANAAVMCAVRLPDITHLAIPPPLRFVPHVEAPIRWNYARVSHDALVEGREQVQEEDVVHEQDEHSGRAPQLGPPIQKHEG
mmetsp:Transcript_44548/g.128774  ORF Transcript_44548/g.128774 Transcript_44548/m.128774 type:complete len:269 (-) Transcript_44548:275-1081(-)